MRHGSDEEWERYGEGDWKQYWQFHKPFEKFGVGLVLPKRAFQISVMS